MKIATIKTGLASLAMLPGLVMAAPAVADKADNAFMMICTALVLFMTIPGIALFYGGLIRGKNVLSMLTQVTVTFALVCILWVVYGYSLAFGEGNNFFGNINWLMLKNIELTAVMGSIYQYIHVAFQGSFACITVGLIVGALAERIRFSAVLIFVVVWLTLSYIPIAHMVWGGGLLASHGALDFAGGTVVHINAAIAGLVGAYLIGKRVGFGKEAFKPHNLPMVFTGTAILYIGWFGFNAGSAGTANEIAALAFVNTVVATAAAILARTNKTMDSAVINILRSLFFLPDPVAVLDGSAGRNDDGTVCIDDPFLYGCVSFIFIKDGDFCPLGKPFLSQNRFSFLHRQNIFFIIFVPQRGKRNGGGIFF